MAEFREPTITINGVSLTTAQAMTVRVALQNFAMELSDPEFKEAVGEIGPLYLARIGEINRLMME